jgi:hypothetical protein
MKKKYRIISICLALLVALSSVANAAVDPITILKKQLTSLKSQLTKLTNTSVALKKINATLTKSVKELEMVAESKSQEISNFQYQLNGLTSLPIVYKGEEDSEGYTKLKGKSLELSDSTSFDIPFDVTKDAITGIVFFNGSQQISGDYQIAKNRLIFNSYEQLMPATKYSFKIYTKSGQRYILSASTPSNVIIKRNQTQAIRIQANPAKGFNYSYYLMVPNGVKSKTFMMVETNNTQVQMDISIDDFLVKNNEVHGSVGSRIAQSMGIPFLVPVFPRPDSRPTMYTHELDRETLLETTGQMARIDLQLKAMIEDARRIFASNDITLEKKVFMAGFSASGRFANKFTALHPELVQAVAVGGINAATILPMSNWKGRTLRYPVGVADLQAISGEQFNFEVYKKVPQFIYMGAEDTNDITQFFDGFDPEDRDLTWEVLGKDIRGDRWTNLQAGYAESGVSAQFHKYAGIGHQITGKILMDSQKFFEANRGSTFNKITPSNSGN